MGGNRRSDAVRCLSIGFVGAILLVSCGCRGKNSSSAADSTHVSPANVVAQASGGSGADDAAGKADSSAERTRKPISLDASVVVRGDLVHSVIAEGILRARMETEIKAELSGTLDRLQVDEGSEVRAGQLLAVIDPREYQAALDEARARHWRALSEMAVNLEQRSAGGERDTALAAYEQSLERLRDERDAGRIDADEFRLRSEALELRALQDGAFVREVLEARTGFAEARAAEERSRLNLERTEIRAPFAGTVADLTPVAGERIQIGQLICRLVNTRDLEAEVHVLESDLGSLSEGRPALLTIPSVERTLPVRVTSVSPRVETESRTCRVLFRFKNDLPLIRPGMFVRAEIATDILPDRLLVPKEAVLEREKRPLVFKIAGDVAQWIYVQTGERNPAYVEITGVAPGMSLDAGDQVVVSDHLTLAHEARVKVREVIQIPDPWRVHFPATDAAGE